VGLEPSTPGWWLSLQLLCVGHQCEQEPENILFIFLAGHLFSCCGFLISCFL
jgi:hypothetical protein